jgi:DedD protein
VDPRLKERLIGAAVLVALGVVFVPWVLNGPDPASAPSSVPAQLPPQDQAEPVRTQTIELGRSDQTPGPVTQRNEDAGAATVRHDSAAAARPPSELETAAQRIAQPRAAERKAAVEPEPQTRSAGPQTASAHPAAARPDPATATGRWAVQLGAFGEEENARRLAARVKTYGFDADVSTYRSGGRQMHRVRTRPVETRERAEAAASSLTAHGFVAQVVSAD